MTRYRAKVADGKTPGDAIFEVEVCGGSDFQVAEDKKSITFLADINDIPSIEAVSSVAGVTEVKEGNDDRGLYVGLKG